MAAAASAFSQKREACRIMGDAIQRGFHAELRNPARGAWCVQIAFTRAHGEQVTHLFPENDGAIYLSSEWQLLSGLADIGDPVVVASFRASEAVAWDYMRGLQKLA